MNHNLIIRLLFILLFCGLHLPTQAQLQNNALTDIFSQSDIKKLNKADDFLERGNYLYPEIGTIIDQYNEGKQHSLSENQSLLNHADKYELLTTLRAGRAYYSGEFTKTNIYLNRLKKLKQEGKDKNLINSLIDKYHQKIRSSKSDYNKSRNSHHLENAVMWNAFAISKHKNIQAEIYKDLTSLLSEKPKEVIAESHTDSIQTASTSTVETVDKPLDEPVNVKEETPITTITETPDLKEEIKTDVILPETYFSIQIMADKKKAVDSQLTRVYSGKRKIMMHEGDGWFRYSVGKFNSVEKASSIMKSENIKGFVVAYSDNKRITISQAKTILNSRQ